MRLKSVWSVVDHMFLHTIVNLKIFENKEEFRLNLAKGSINKNGNNDDDDKKFTKLSLSGFLNKYTI